MEVRVEVNPIPGPITFWDEHLGRLTVLPLPKRPQSRPNVAGQLRLLEIQNHFRTVT